jgi:quercetin dioxygenase-like cupin family protein
MDNSKQYKLKNIELAKILKMEDEISYQKGQVVSKTLVQNKNISITLFSFDQGEEISAHSSDGDAMVTILDGTGKFTVGDEVFILNKGETLIMPNQVSHAVYGEEQFKMLLTVIF